MDPVAPIEGTLPGESLIARKPLVLKGYNPALASYPSPASSSIRDIAWSAPCPWPQGIVGARFGNAGLWWDVPKSGAYGLVANPPARCELQPGVAWRLRIAPFTTTPLRT